MAKGDLISYSNFSNTYTSELLYESVSTPGNTVYSAYVSSPSWYANVIVNKSFGSKEEYTIYASYWNGSTWVEAWREARGFDKYLIGQLDYQYYHNSTLGSTPKDVASAVLWEIHLEHSAKLKAKLEMYTGSIGCMPEDTYNNLYKGRPIYSCGGLGLSSVYGSLGGRARDRALSTFSQSADRGTLISASNEHKLVAYKYN